MRAYRAIACASLPLSLSCAGAATTVPAPAPTVAVVSAAPRASTPPAQPEITPAPAPDRLIVSLHVAHPARLLPVIAPFAGPLSQAIASIDSESLAKMVLHAPVGPIVDLSQSFDLALTMPPTDSGDDDLDPDIALSGALVDSEEARLSLERFFSLDPVAGDGMQGAFRLRALKDGDAEPVRPCLVAAALPRGQRLVCASSEAALNALAPYVARTLPSTPSRADVHAELQVPPFYERFLSGPLAAARRTSEWEVGDQLLEGFFRDLGVLGLDVSDDDGAIDATLSLSFAGATPATRVLFGQATRRGAPPAAFARLPRDSGMAIYADGAAPADAAPLQATVLDSMGRVMAKDGMPQADADAFVANLSKLVLTGGPWVMASGRSLDAPARALDAYVASGKTAESARVGPRASLQGWTVVGVDEPPDKWIAGARELVRLDHVKAVTPTQKEAVKREAAKSKSTSQLTITPVPPHIKLPAGSLHIENRTTPKAEWLAAHATHATHATHVASGEAPVIAHTTHVFIVPDGARTWIAFAEDPALAADHVRASLSAAPVSGTLQGRPGFDDVMKAGAGGAVWLSFDELAMLAVGDTSDAELQKAHDAVHALLSIGDVGTMLVPLTLDTTPAIGGNPATGTVHARVPIAVITQWSAVAALAF